MASLPSGVRGVLRLQQRRSSAPVRGGGRGREVLRRNVVDAVGRRTGMSRKWSVATVVFLVNVCGTFAAMGFGISLASAAAGVPIFPR